MIQICLGSLIVMVNKRPAAIGSINKCHKYDDTLENKSAGQSKKESQRN